LKEVFCLAGHNPRPSAWCSCARCSPENPAESRNRCRRRLVTGLRISTRYFPRCSVAGLTAARATASNWSEAAFAKSSLSRLASRLNFFGSKPCPPPLPINQRSTASFCLSSRPPINRSACRCRLRPHLAAEAGDPQDAAKLDRFNPLAIGKGATDGIGIGAIGVVTIDRRNQDRELVGSRLLAKRPRSLNRLAQGTERIGSGRKGIVGSRAKESAQPCREARDEGRPENAPDNMLAEPAQQPAAGRARFCFQSGVVRRSRPPPPAIPHRRSPQVLPSG
jgi:hypothetical protein